jgi:hypothetical protein
MQAQSAYLFPDQHHSGNLSWITHVFSTIASSSDDLGRSVASIISWDPANYSPVEKWYARSFFWKTSSMRTDQFIQEMCVQYELHLSDNIQKAICELTERLYTTKAKPHDSLRSFLEDAFTRMYVQDPVSALQIPLSLARKNSQVWAPFVKNMLENAKNVPNTTLQKDTGQIFEECFRNLDAYNLVIMGGLWQIMISPQKNPEDIQRLLSETVDLFSDCQAVAHSSKKEDLASVSVVLQIAPRITDMLTAAPVFSEDQRKRSVYDALVQEIALQCATTYERFFIPGGIRSSKIYQEFGLILEKLHELQALFEEGTKEQEELSRSLPLPGLEDPVRLFQELDRSDRELYGT